MNIIKRLGFVRIKDVDSKIKSYQEESSDAREITDKRYDEIIKLKVENKRLNDSLLNEIASKREQVEADLLMNSMNIIKRLLEGETRGSKVMNELVGEQKSLSASLSQLTQRSLQMQGAATGSFGQSLGGALGRGLY